MEDGTLEQIVHWLFQGEFTPQKVNVTQKLLICIPLYCSAEAFWDHFEVAANKGITNLPIATPANHILTIWLDLCFARDFTGKTFKKMLKFLCGMPTNLSNKHKLQLLKYSKPVPNSEAKVQKRKHRSHESKRNSTGTFIIQTLNLQNLDLKQLAEQMTYYERNLFCKIEDTLLSGDFLAEGSPLAELTLHFNGMSHWITGQILDHVSLNDRVETLSACIELMNICAKMNNFHALMIVLSAVNCTPIQRLKQTWMCISDAHKNTLKECETLMTAEKNFKNYRPILKLITGPIMPYVGIITKDLTSWKEVPTFTACGMINVTKVMGVGSSIKQVKKMQQHVYALPKVEAILDFIQKANPIDDEILYNKSVLCEPLAQ